MLQAFKAASVPLFVSYYRRYLPRFRKVKQLIQSGEIGSVVSIDYRMAKPPKKNSWRPSPESSGGGPFYDLSGHMLDLFDDWFGPLNYLGGGASNVVPQHETEDVVNMAFRCDGGALGTARWNFASTLSEDHLTIDGVHGRISMKGTSVAGRTTLQRDARSAVRTSASLRTRSLRQVKQKLKLPFRETFKFDAELPPHLPFLKRVNQQLLQRAGTGSDRDSGKRDAPPAEAVDDSAWHADAEAALRTSLLMNQVLSNYYGGRSDAFWKRPATWQSLRNQAALRVGEDTTPEYLLSDEQVSFFEREGYLGPFRCDGDWQKVLMPVKKGRNLHLTEARVFQLCTHPSIVRRAAQLIGKPDIALFKSRFVVKSPETSKSEVAWHQDVGTTNGGYLPNGEPVPTLSIWLALDEVTLENGAMEVLGGSHHQLVGNYEKKIRAELRESGVLTDAALEKAFPMELKPGEFYIFHSWLLHGSNPNTSTQRRGGLNIRFVQRGYECEEGVIYFPLRCNDPMHTTLTGTPRQSNTRATLESA